MFIRFILSQSNKTQCNIGRASLHTFKIQYNIMGQHSPTYINNDYVNKSN